MNEHVSPEITELNTHVYVSIKINYIRMHVQCISTLQSQRYLQFLSQTSLLCP